MQGCASSRAGPTLRVVNTAPGSTLLKGRRALGWSRNSEPGGEGFAPHDGNSTATTNGRTLFLSPDYLLGSVPPLFCPILSRATSWAAGRLVSHASALLWTPASGLLPTSQGHPAALRRACSPPEIHEHLLEQSRPRQRVTLSVKCSSEITSKAWK